MRKIQATILATTVLLGILLIASERTNRATAAAAAAAEKKTPPSSDTQSKKGAMDALSEFNSLIGGWRGTGQPRRGSARGAWRETAEWVWDFKKDSVAINYVVDKGKILKSARVVHDPKKKKFIVVAVLPDNKKRKYVGIFKDKKLVVESAPDADDIVHRITITRLNPKRTLVLFEKRRKTQSFYARVAEIGYTRQGTRLASNEATGPICIVTGGTGTSKVMYKGKTYYVCCSGCRDAFLDDPKGVIAEAKQRAEEKRKKEKKS